MKSHRCNVEAKVISFVKEARKGVERGLQKLVLGQITLVVFQLLESL